MVRCIKDDVDLQEVETDFEYGGVLLRGVKAMRCPVCGEESLDLEQYGMVKKRLEALVKPLKLRRKITVAGKRPAIYLPEDVIRATNTKVGDEVEIHTEGRKIIIEPVDAE